MIIRPYSDKNWFSPCRVIKEWANIESSGDKKKIKRAREAWVCAVALLCHSKIEPAEWWIQVPKNDPPDVLAMKLIPHKKGLGNTMSPLPVEVFEISEYDTESIKQSIERKLKNKDYSGVTLIGFVRRNQIFMHEKIGEYIKKSKPKIHHMLLLVNEQKTGTNFSLIHIFPDGDVFKTVCDWGVMCKTTKQVDFVTASKSTKVPEKIVDYTKDLITLIP
jgi:hypothetical protein